jgi:CO/xanthine dehydrogenase Mo-binding subunit
VTKLKGRGMAAVNYPTGMNLGGDPTIALIHASTSGNFNISISSVELGQGLKTVLAQIGAEALGVPLENVVLHNHDTDTGPYCTGTFASRTTHRAGNAIIMAAEEARQIMLEEAAEMLEVDEADLDTDGAGNIVVRGTDRSLTVAEVCSAAHFVHGRAIAGRGIFFKAKSVVDPDTGAMDPDSTEAHACTVAEIEVDTETGQIQVLRLTSAYEVGRALNPRLVHGQIVGGAWMGVSHTLYETTAPYYPLVEHAPVSFSDYLMPGPAESPVIEAEVLGIPSSNGPYGQKGVGEMTANSPIPAIVNALYDAIGVRFYELPITPEKVLRALEEKAAGS